MKPALLPPARTARNGVTITELLVVASVLIGLFVILARLQTFTGQSSAEDSQRAAYFQAVSRLLEQVNRDLKSALTVAGASDSLVITLPDGAGAFATTRVEYTVDRRANTVTRATGGQRQTFSFGAPLQGGDQIVFDVKIGR